MSVSCIPNSQHSFTQPIRNISLRLYPLFRLPSFAPIAPTKPPHEVSLRLVVIQSENFTLTMYLAYMHTPQPQTASSPKTHTPTSSPIPLLYTSPRAVRQTAIQTADRSGYRGMLYPEKGAH